MKPLTQEQGLNSVAKQVRRPRIDAILISSDDSFLIELGPLLGDHYRTHTVDSPLALGNLLHKSSWLAIVDVAAVPDAHVALGRMAQRYPQAPIIVVAPRVADWSAMASRGTIVAALAREELAGPRFSEALEAASARVSQDGSTQSIRTGSFRFSAPASSRPARLELRLLLPWALLLIAIVAVGGWLYRVSAYHRTVAAAPTSSAPAPAVTAPVASSSESAPVSIPAAPTPAPASAASRSQTILELLSAARVQFHDQKLLFPRAEGEPRGDSALELYAQVLSQEPGNAEAQDGIARLWAIAKGRIQNDVASGRLDDASQLIALFKAAGVDEELLRPTASSVNAARPKLLLARVQQSIAAGDLASATQMMQQMAGSGADPETVNQLQRALEAKRLEQQLTALSAQVQAAIGSGALIGSEGDTALTRLSAMRALSRTHALTLTAQRDIRAALIARAQQAIQQHQFDDASRYLTATSDLGSSAEISDTRRQLQEEMERVRQGDQAAAQAQAEAAKAAAALAAEPVQPSAPKFIAAAPLHPLDVSYPAEAQGMEGRVILEFTLHADGSASDVAVIDAKPKSIFNRAALEAVRHGRYDASTLVNGQSQRARISLHFKPD